MSVDRPVFSRRTSSLMMDDSVDPKAEILNELAEVVGQLIIRPADVLVAIYQRPEKTKGGLYLADKTRDEDKFQGCAGLILKMGELAFTEDKDHKWGAFKPRVGDWVAFSIGETRARDIMGKRCRIMNELVVDMILPRPDIVW